MRAESVLMGGSSGHHGSSAAPTFSRVGPPLRAGLLARLGSWACMRATSAYLPSPHLVPAAPNSTRCTGPSWPSFSSPTMSASQMNCLWCFETI